MSNDDSNAHYVMLCMSDKSRQHIYNHVIFPGQMIVYNCIGDIFITLPCVYVDVMGDRAQVHIVANKDKEYTHDVWLYTHWGGTGLIEVVAHAISRGERWQDSEYLTRIIFSEMIERDIHGSMGYGIGNHQHGDVYRVITVDVDEQEITIDGWREVADGTHSFADFGLDAFEVVGLP